MQPQALTRDAVLLISIKTPSWQPAAVPQRGKLHDHVTLQAKVLQNKLLPLDDELRFLQQMGATCSTARSTRFEALWCCSSPPAENSHAWMVMQWHAGTRRQLEDAYGHGGVVMDVQVGDSALEQQHTSVSFPLLCQYVRDDLRS